MSVGFGLGAVLTAGGLMFLKPWAKYLAYGFAICLAANWLYVVWQITAQGWPYEDVLLNVFSLLPGLLLLLICVGGAYVVYS